MVKEYKCILLRLIHTINEKKLLENLNHSMNKKELLGKLNNSMNEKELLEKALNGHLSDRFMQRVLAHVADHILLRLRVWNFVDFDVEFFVGSISLADGSCFM